MFFTKKVWITLAVTLAVAVIAAAVAVTLVMVLDNEEEHTEEHTEEYTEKPTEKPEPVCDDDRNYRRMSLKSGLKSHVEKFQRHGPPPLEVPATRATIPDTAWITQRIDHFDATNLETWEMRYMSNSEFYVEGGPMFIFLGGEWEITTDYLVTGHMYDIAKESNGYMFYTEHRYYGQSFPTKDLCLYNLQFQSAGQAMADIAYFIEYQKSTIPGMENSKVVVVGGSYSAMLATWMRIKYPHLVDAAWSSSAPLRAVANFHEYFQVVGDSLRSTSEECVSAIAEAIEEIDGYFETENGVAHLSNLLGMQNPINSTEPSKSYFFFTLASPFAAIVQYSSGTDIQVLCSILLSLEGTAFQKFLTFTGYIYGDYQITDYEYYVNYMRDSFNTDDIARQWYYQTCTEFGFYQTSTSSNQPFKNFGLDLFQSMCEDIFGISSEVINSGIERTNLFYGSVFPEVTKVVSTHGSMDPWHPLGVLEDINEEAPVFVIEGASHCADLASLNAIDSEEMKFAKTKIKEYITKWIQ